MLVKNKQNKKGGTGMVTKLLIYYETLGFLNLIGIIAVIIFICMIISAMLRFGLRDYEFFKCPKKEKIIGQIFKFNCISFIGLYLILLVGYIFKGLHYLLSFLA